MDEAGEDEAAGSTKGPDDIPCSGEHDDVYAGMASHRVGHRHWARVVVCMAASCVLAVVAAVWLAPQVSVSGPVLFGEVTVTGGGEAGVTRLDVPLAGSVEADTHDGVLGMVVRADSVDLGQLEQSSDESLSGGAVLSGATEGLEDLARRWARSFVVGAGVLGVLSGLVVAALARPRRLRAVAGLAGCGMAAGVLSAGGLAWWSAASFSAAGFDTPRYSGVLSYAPDVIDAVSSRGLVGVRDGAGAVSGRLDRLVRVGGEGSTGARQAGDVVVLHVSDLHLNPLGLEMAKRLVEQFSPDAVIDSGDFTSFGATPAEGGFAALADVGVPYYLVGGNHDSAEALAAARAAGVEVIDGGVVEVAGLSITGLADPTFTPREPVPDAKLQAAYDAQRPELAELARRSGAEVVVVHNPGVADALAGEDLTVVSGHIHRFAAEAEGPTRLVVSGSAGSGGLGSLASGEAGRYEAQLLTFRAGSDGRMRLVWIDRVSTDEAALGGEGGGRSSIERLEAERLGQGPYLSGGEVPGEGPLRGAGEAGAAGVPTTAAGG